MSEERKGWWIINMSRMKDPPTWFQVGVVGLPVLLIGFIILPLFFKMVFKAFNDDFEILKTLFPILAGLFATPFLIWKLVLTHKQTITNEAKKDIDREVAFTNLYTKSVELLGATREVKIPKLVKDKDNNDKYETETRTAPNMEVRLGALYALDRLASESEKDQDAIQEVLCAYIRLNSWYNELGEEVDCFGFPLSKENDNLDFSKFKEPAEYYFKNGNLNIKDSKTVSRPDITSAIKILGNRIDKWNRVSPFKTLNLTNCRIANHVFTNLNFKGVDFSQSHIKNTNFNNVKFINVKFKETVIYDCQIIESIFDESYSLNIKLIKVIYYKNIIILNNTNIIETYRTDFYNCDFSKSKSIYIINKGSTSLSNCDFTNCNLKGLENFSQEDINRCKGNENTVLTSNFTRPAKWKPLAPEHMGKGV